MLKDIPEIVGEIAIVDGHSKDRTVEVAPKLTPDALVVYQDGRGKGNALKCGPRPGNLIYTP